MTSVRAAWIFELLWIILALVVTAIVILPVYGTIDWSYLKYNVAMVFLSVTYFRQFLFIRRIPYLAKIWMRVLLILLLGVLFFQFMIVIQHFFWDMDGATISRFLTPEKALEHSEHITSKYLYFRREFIFFAVACQTMGFLLALRLVHSMWQFSNNKMNKA